MAATRNKPIIGIDLDGVVFDFAGPFLHEINYLHGLDVTPAQLTEFEFEDCLPGVTKEIVDATWRACVCEDFWRALPLIDGAKDAVAKLREDYRVWFITARKPQWYNITAQGLKHHGIEYDALISSGTSARKIEFADTLSLMVEDKFDTALAMANAGCPVMVMDYPHNRKDSRLTRYRVFRAYNWPSIVELVPFAALDRRHHIAGAA